MCAFLFGGNTHAWNSPLILSALGAATCSFTLFIIHQNYWATYPLLTKSAYSDRNFTGSCLGMFLIGASEAAALLIIPQFLMVFKNMGFKVALLTNGRACFTSIRPNPVFGL